MRCLPNHVSNFSPEQVGHNKVDLSVISLLQEGEGFASNVRLPTAT
jgi:hypothetical protein